MNLKHKHTMRISIVIMLLFIMILAIYGYAKSIDRNISKYSQFALDEIITLQKDAIYTHLVSDINILESLAISFEMNNVSVEEALNIVSSYSRANNTFEKIILFDLNGYGQSSDGNNITITDQNILEKLHSPETIISTTELNIIGDNTLKISTPVYDLENDNIMYIIVGSYNLDKINNSIEEAFSIEDSISILNSKGDFIFSNKRFDDSTSTSQRYLADWLAHVKLVSGDTHIAENLNNGTGGSFVYEQNNKAMYCKYAPLGINDWFITAHVDKALLTSNATFDRKDILILLLVMGICLGVLAVYALIVRNNSKTILANLALYDKLTGLPTSENFKSEINKMSLDGITNSTFCIVFDICNFKLINDRFGIPAGDEMLKKIAEVMHETQQNNPTDTIFLAKLYSDTFAILIVNITEEALLEKASEFFKKCKEASKFLGEYNLNLSCGRYMRQPGDSGEIILERALTAHAHSKDQKPNIFVDYDNAFIERLHTHSDIIDSFGKAIKDGEFHIYLQPQYKASNEKLSGGEVLVRWIKDGSIKYPPNIFIPVLEDAGKISELDSYLREQICISMRRWLDEGISIVPISLNVSRIELLEEHFVSNLLNLVNKYDIEPMLLHIEITETAYVGDYKYLIDVVTQLSSHGFHVEMDDFGSGYSSLNVLKDIPIDTIKLDMKFIENGTHESRSGNILSSIVRMTQGIDLITIAEGVETRAQIDYLRSIGCDYMQGYYFAKPMPLVEFEQLLKGNEVKLDWKLENAIGINDAANFLNATAQETLLFNTFLGGAAIVEYSNDTLRVLRINDKCYEVFGKTRDTLDVFKYNLLDMLAPEHKEYIKSQLKKAIETGKEVSGEAATLPLEQNDQGMWQSYSLRCLGKKGNRYVFYLMLHDITVRKNLEESLTAEIKKSQAVIESMPGGYIQINVIENVVKVLYASDGICQRVKYTPEEMRGLDSINSIIHPLDLEKVQAGQIATIQHGEPFGLDLRFVSKSGDIIWFSCTGNYTRIDNKNGIFDGFFYDVTALYEAREKVEAFVNNTSDGYAQFSIKEGTIITDYVNDAFCKMSGYDDEEFLTRHINSFAHPDDMEMIETAEFNTIVNDLPFKVEYRFQHKDGHYIWLRVVGRYVRTGPASGTFYGSFFNIDSFKKMEMQLVALQQLSNQDNKK